MTKPDLTQLVGVQEKAKEQIMTEPEAKQKLDLFEKMFAEGYYIQARKIADELYSLDIDSARGYAMVCSRAYEHYHKLLDEKGEESVIRVNVMFMKYHFGDWLLPLNREIKRNKDIDNCVT